MNIIEMAMAAKMAGGNGGGGTGPIDPKRLPEGYPYKESRVTADASALFGPGAILCKVSDNTPEPMEVGASLEVWFDGSPMVGQVTLAGDDWFAGSELAVSVAYKAGATLVAGPISITYPESGVYFMRVPEAASVTGVAWDSTATEPDITWDGVAETIHPMAPEFLPAGVGGNDREFIVELTQDGHGQYGSEMTFAEILAQFDAGKAMVAYLTLPDNHCYKSCGSFGSSDGVAFFFMGLNIGNIGVPLVVMCTSDGTWSGQSASDLG